MRTVQSVQKRVHARLQTIVVASALAIATAAPASATVSDPEVLIYRFPGVFDNGDPSNTGVATVFHCTNFSGATETIRLVTRDTDTTLKSNGLFFISHLATMTFGTHLVNSYVNENTLSTLTVNQGTTAIAATSIDIICTAMTIDATATVPVGVALRGIRFSPVPGSQE